jgi:uncharacterized membrane protein YdbT with pleckstrin-like domain
MGYVSGILQPEERVLASGQLHWIIYRYAAVAIIFSILLFSIAHISQRTPMLAKIMAVAAILTLAAAACLTVAAWFNQWITEIAVTNLRVIYKHGFIRRHTAEMNMDKIESVTVTQSILGRMLDYGSIHIRGTGAGMEPLHEIRAPIWLRTFITTR